MMTSTDELLEALKTLHDLFPEWRVGQLVANLTQAAGRDRDGAIWDVEDKELLQAAKRLIERNNGRNIEREHLIEPAHSGVS